MSLLGGVLVVKHVMNTQTQLKCWPVGQQEEA